MKKTAQGLLRTLARRGVITAIPVAMVCGYATNMAVPTPPRLAEYAIQQVAEITVSPDTVGIAESPLYGESQAAINTQLDQLQALGVQNIRVFVPWALVEPAANTYDWSLLDEVMSAAAARNMGVLAEVNSTPVWATASGQVTYNGASTPSPTAMAAFMSVFAAKYGSTVSAYEIWNEPNGVMFSNPIDPVAYAQLLQAVYPVIKAADPTATVIAGALGHVYTVNGLTMDPVDFVQAMLNAGAGNYFDALSYHPYDESLPFSQGNVNPNSGGFASDTAYNQVTALMALIPTKKVWITEYGVPTYSYSYVDGNGVTQTVTVTQAQQAQYIQDLLQNWDKLGQAGPLFLYTGEDTATGSSDPNANYGIFTDAGLPKAVVAYLQAYYLAHPQNPTTTPPPGQTTPPNPTNPVAALQAALQAFAQQVAQAFANAISQSFVQTLGQQIAHAITTAIAAVLAALGQPVATPAAALSLKAASAAPPAVSNVATGSTAADSSSTTSSAAKVLAGRDTPAKDSAAASAADGTEVAAKATDVTASVAATKEPTATTPTATTPTATTPTATTPTATTPTVAEPVVAKTPEPVTPAAPESTTSTSTDSATSAPATGKGDAESPSKSGDTNTGDKGRGNAAKSGDSTSAGSDSSGSNEQGKFSQHSKGKGAKGTTAAEAKPAASDTSGSAK